jgi:hypothetical protein
MDLSIGDRVVLTKGLPQRHDHVGSVVRLDDGDVWVQWEGPEAPSEPSKYRVRALARA